MLADAAGVHPRETLVVLVRHGRTELNVAGQFRGRADPPLDDAGRRQAEQIGVAVGRLRPAAIYTSPRARARATARPLERVTSLPVTICTDLDDLDYGSWTGRTPAQALDEDPTAYGLWTLSAEQAQPPGGERVVDAVARLRRALLTMRREHEGHTVVAVTHDISIRLLACHVLGAPVSAMHRLLVDVGSTSAIAFGDGVPKLAWLNRTEHLDRIDAALAEGRQVS
jgi:probable phosphoglycerate mutase